MNLLVLPGGMPEALQFATEARLRGRRLVGASSLVNDPAVEEYDHWARLPLLNAVDFDQQLLSLIDSQAIDEIYVAHFLMWRHVHALLSECRSEVELVNAAPAALFQASHELFLRQMERLGSAPELHNGVGQEPLSEVERRALFLQAQRIFGHSDDEKILAMMEVVRSLPQGDLVEIGSKAGRSAFVLGWLARHYAIGNVLCVDPWNQADALRQTEIPDIARQQAIDNDYNIYFDQFIMNMLAFLPGTVNYLRCMSDDALPRYLGNRAVHTPELGEVEYCGRIACLHVDGNHDFEFARRDIAYWSEQLLPGGWIIVDDYHWAFGDGAQRAADAFIAEQAERIYCAFDAGGALFLCMNKPPASARIMNQ